MDIFFCKKKFPILELKRIENNTRIQVITFFIRNSLETQKFCDSSKLFSDIFRGYKMGALVRNELK